MAGATLPAGMLMKPWCTSGIDGVALGKHMEPCTGSNHPAVSAGAVPGERWCSTSALAAAGGGSAQCWGCGAWVGEAPRRFPEAAARGWAAGAASHSACSTALLPALLGLLLMSPV